MMDIQAVMDNWSAFKQEVPDTIEVFELRRLSIDDLKRRLRRLLKGGGNACDRQFDHGEWTTHDDRTFVRLPDGASGVVYHASGAMKLHTGLAPMAHLFAEPEARGAHVKRGEAYLDSLDVRALLGHGETLSFERLWQIKARAFDLDGRGLEPVLCRAVAAFRQHVRGVPVLGAASVAVQMAGEGRLDTVSTHLRGSVGGTLDKAKVLSPERGARALAQQLATLMHGGGDVAQIESRDGMRFGYLSMGKRKLQRLLAPVYMASVEVARERVRQACVLVVSATERNYLPLNPPGHEYPVSAIGKLASRRCCG